MTQIRGTLSTMEPPSAFVGCHSGFTRAPSPQGSLPQLLRVVARRESPPGGCRGMSPPRGSVSFGNWLVLAGVSGAHVGRRSEGPWHYSESTFGFNKKEHHRLIKRLNGIGFFQWTLDPQCHTGLFSRKGWWRAPPPDRGRKARQPEVLEPPSPVQLLTSEGGAAWSWSSPRWCCFTRERCVSPRFLRLARLEPALHPRDRQTLLAGETRDCFFGHCTCLELCNLSAPMVFRTPTFRRITLHPQCSGTELRAFRVLMVFLETDWW